MRSQDLKLRFAVLWLLQTVNYTAYLLIPVIETEPFGAGVDPARGLRIAVFFFFPSLLAWLSVASLRASRWPNLVFGAFVGWVKLSACLGFFGEPSSAVILNELWGFFAASLVVWYAWKQPAILSEQEKEPASASA